MGGSSGSGGGPGAGGRSGSGGLPSAGGGAGAGGSDAGCAASCGLGAIFACCDGSCVNQENDPHHCGACGTSCPANAPLCLQGKCVVPACGDSTVPDAALPACASGTTCCGTSCCGAGQLCCDVERGGPASFGSSLGCFDPSQSNGTCPVGCPQCVCASPDTPIATPTGERAIATLAVGDVVYSVDHGQVTEVPIVAVHRRAAHDHHVVRVTLEGGAVLEISAPHPTADGRHFGDLRAGDLLDGKRIVSETIIPYAYAFTVDILPASDSGTYFAAGALIGSTLGGTALSLSR